LIGSFGLMAVLTLIVGAIGLAGAGTAHGAVTDGALLLLLALAVLLATLMSWWLIRSIVRPLESLGEAAQRLAAGDTAIADILPLTEQPEIARLSSTLRGMASYQEQLAAVQCARSRVLPAATWRWPRICSGLPTALCMGCAVELGISGMR
jgi:methyl-accepting chemotaxis protein